MPEKFLNQYRIESARLPHYDYSANGYYFVTVCIKNRKHYFGEVVNKKMQLSPFGEIARQCWIEIPKHFPFVILEEFVIMPNHTHGIVTINKLDPTDAATQNDVETQDIASLRPFASIPESGVGDRPNKFGPQSKNLASIIRGFKIGVKKYATIHNIEFVWQARYHDHVIRNEESLARIRKYIQDNPENWERDEFNV